MADVVMHEFLFDAPQRRPNRADLRDDIDAVAILFDHTRKAAHLTFDAVEPLQNGVSGFMSHG